jgi:hypothetical protein
MLHDWTNFFSITGAAGAQLIGLMFVVVTLSTGLSTSQSEEAIRAFLTPTLVSFSGVLFQAIVVLAPWPSDLPIGLIFVLGGLAGLAYRIRAIRLKGRLDFAALRGLDWIAYNGVPLLGDLSLLAGAGGFIAEEPFAPYAVACASALLLASGIYGAWDLTLWIVKNRRAS